MQLKGRERRPGHDSSSDALMMSSQGSWGWVSQGIICPHVLQLSLFDSSSGLSSHDTNRNQGMKRNLITFLLTGWTWKIPSLPASSTSHLPLLSIYRLFRLELLQSGWRRMKLSHLLIPRLFSVCQTHINTNCADDEESSSALLAFFFTSLLLLLDFLSS